MPIPQDHMDLAPRTGYVGLALDTARASHVASASQATRPKGSRAALHVPDTRMAAGLAWLIPWGAGEAGLPYPFGMILAVIVFILVVILGLKNTGTADV